MAKGTTAHRYFDGINNQFHELDNQFYELFKEAEKQGYRAKISEEVKNVAKFTVEIKHSVKLSDYYNDEDEKDIVAETKKALTQIDNGDLENESLRQTFCNDVKTQFYKWLSEKYKDKIPVKTVTETSYSSSGEKFVEVCEVVDYSKYFTTDIFKEFLREYNLQKQQEASELEKLIAENETYVGFRTPPKTKTTEVATNNQTTQTIIRHLNAIDKNQNWAYAFRNETDFNSFIALLTAFFEASEYTLPTTPIQLKKGCKTRLAKVLGGLHKEISLSDTLAGDTNFFDVVRTLNHFANETDLYKALTRT
jgi:hypothetical protein